MFTLKKLTIIASAVTALIGPKIALANEQVNNTNIEEPIEKIAVLGIRTSTINSVDQKRSSQEISDSITAEDIGKFPDLNVAESLQRISGIQISRSRGEASGIAIRGLDEVATLLNGRNYFGGASDLSINRFASFEDIPAELVGSVKVYKSISADLLEGGIGGVVDIERTNSLSLDGFTLVGSVKGHYGDLAQDWSPRGSIVTGNNWDLDNDQRIGVIFGFSYLERAFREDLVRNSKPTSIAGTFPSGTAPADTIASASINASPAWGDRERTVYSVGVDFEASKNTSFYFDAGYTDYSTTQYRQEFVWGFDGKNVTDADFSNVNGGNRYPKSVDFSDMNFDVLSMIDDRYTTTYDAAIGFENVNDSWALSGEISYVDTDNDTAFRNSRIRDNWNALPVVVSNAGSPSQPPSVDFKSFDYTNANNFNQVQWRHESRQLTADESAIKFDADFFIDDSFFTSIETGVRYARLNTLKNIQNNHVFDASGNTYGSDDPLNLVEPSVWNNFMDNYNGGNFPSNYLAINPKYLLSKDSQIRSQYGIGLQSEIENPRDYFDYSEETSAIYLKANFNDEFGGIFVSGNFGLRYVRTDTLADYFFNTGNQDSSGSDIYETTNSSKDYDEVLPSFNINFELTDELMLRLAGSSTIARPHFGDMAPSLNLNYEQGRGTGGNPDLEPFTADSLDLSLEYYFGQGGLLSSAIFYKNVDGFLQTTENVENISGTDFVILRKSNGESGKVQGVELSYQQFFDFLPSPFDGLGVQANYTYVDSDVPSPNPELPNISLEGLSDNSYNLVAIYENDFFSGRLSYNYRSDFLVSTEVEQEGFGQLDASLSYTINDNFRISLDALNLLRREHHEFRAGDSQDPYHWIATERQVLAGFTYKY
ncbi:TonB-dependent receptor [Shewanella gaetbuli]